MNLSSSKNQSSLRGINQVSITSSISSRSSQASKGLLAVGPGYKTIHKIGSGNFGEIWLARDIQSNEKVAVKIEKTRYKSSPLSSEYNLYRKFRSNKFMPAVYHYLQTPKYSMMVMELMGPNLEDIFKANNNSFSLKSILLIGMQTIRIFEFIHHHGVIYRDVKPQNFVIGQCNQKPRTIYILDFGLAKEYINPTTKSHISYSDTRALTGTARYMSINTHHGREQSRRDDLESVGHMLLYFLRGSLPWQGLQGNEKNDLYSKIGQVKMAISIEELCKDRHPLWSAYLKYVRSLDFYQPPDYTYLTNLFVDYYNELNFSDENFDWDHESLISSNPSVSSNPIVDNNDTLKQYRSNYEETQYKVNSYPSLLDHRLSKEQICINNEENKINSNNVYQSYQSRIVFIKPKTTKCQRFCQAASHFLSAITSCSCRVRKKKNDVFILSHGC